MCSLVYMKECRSLESDELMAPFLVLRLTNIYIEFSPPCKSLIDNN